MIVGMAFRELTFGRLVACVLAFAVFALWRNGLIPQWFGVGLILAGFAMTLCIGLAYFGAWCVARRTR
jgi:hypothetical protein